MRFVLFFLLFVACYKEVAREPINVNCPKYESKVSEKEYLDLKAQTLALESEIVRTKVKLENCEKDLLTVKYDRDYCDVKLKDFQCPACEACADVSPCSANGTD